MARRRHRHPITRALTRNPTYVPWLILGGVVAAGTAYFLLSKKSSSGGAGGGGGSATLPSTLTSDCQKRALDVLPLMILNEKDKIACAANPGAQECLRATANAATVDAYAKAFQAACVPGAAPYTGTLPPLPAGLPAVPPACQQTFLQFLELGKKLDAAGPNPPVALLAQVQSLMAQFVTTCGVPLEN